jgi:hypothetical protein
MAAEARPPRQRLSVTPQRRRRGVIAGAAALSYLALAVILWGEAWADGASTHTLCGCGDPSLFLWFFQWPATAIAHGHDPFFSRALFHPGGINLLAQTSVLGLSIPLTPITWIWGPVASLNVASTLCPALSAFATYMVLRRWVSWTPARFLGGLLFGFSPFVLDNLEFAHLMTAALMLLPLILAVLDEILFRQAHSARWGGIWLGVLLFLQFFLSSELVAVIAVTIVVAGAVILIADALVDREALRRRAPHALKAIVIAAGVGGVLLVYPVWFALDGPAHLSGLIWPNLGTIGGYDGSSFVTPNYIHGSNIYNDLGGYEGQQLPSAAYLGWGMLGVLLGGLVIWIKDRRLQCFAFLLALCMVCSLGVRKGGWVPARLFAELPVLKNVIEQRFMTIGFLAAAVMLALILDRARRDVPRWLKVHDAEARILGVGVALGLAAVALLPVAVTFGGELPFAMKPVLLPTWYQTVAPKLPAGAVVLSYPEPFSGIQSAMDWQAVDADHFSQAGGGGPQGQVSRAGPVKAGFQVLTMLSFGVAAAPPNATKANLAAVRQAIADWGVNTVVIAPDAAAPILQQGRDPMYAAAFMTAALGRVPVIQAGAWVWDKVSLPAQSAWHISRSVLPTCVASAEKSVHGHAYHRGQPATLAVSDCVALGAL